MGRYTTIHLAAGIQIPIQKETFELDGYSCGNGCYNGGHSSYRDSDFCPKCGNKIEEAKYESERWKWAQDLIGSENFATMFDEDEINMLFISNLGHGDIENDHNKAILLNGNLMDVKMNEFLKGHKDDIAKLEEALGHQVSVGFYFLHEYS